MGMGAEPGLGAGFYGRRIVWPCQVIDESVKLPLDNGVSPVRCPRKEASRPRARVENWHGEVF
jgi:hypothetical protein